MKYITNDKILYFIALILLVIGSVFIYYIYVQNNGNNFAQTAQQAVNKSSVSSTITNHVNVFTGNDVTGVAINIPNGADKYFNDQASTQSQSFTTYTYQNFFTAEETPKPRIQNVITDLLTGYNYVDNQTQTCLDQDQLSVRYSNHICNNNNRCLSESGNKFITQNGSENFYEENPNLKTCSNSFLGSISFNFRLNAISGYVDLETAFLNIDNVVCGENAYTNINTTNNTFFIDNDLFTSNSNELSDDYIPIFSNSTTNTFQNNNIKQTVKISRYDYNNEDNFSPDAQGMFTEVIFRPGNLFLTAIGTQTGITSINNFTVPAGTVFDNPNLLRYIKQLQGTTSTGGIGAKCFVSNGNVIITDPGQNYLDSPNNEFITQIQDDYQNFVTTNANLITGFSYRFKLKPKSGTSLSESVNWLLIPPTDLSPGSIPKNNFLKDGLIQSFSRSSQISALKLIDNISSSDLPTYKTAVEGSNYIPLPTSSNVATIHFETDNSIKKDFQETINNIAKKNITGTVKNIKISAVTYNNNIYDNYPPYVFEVASSGIQEDRDILSIINFNGQPSDSLLQKVTAGLNAVSYIIPGIGPIATALDVAQLFYNNSQQVSVSTGGFSTLPIDSFNPNLVLDGTAVLEKKDSFLDILAFQSSYFNNATLTNGDAATLISDIQTNENSVSFRDMTKGILDAVDFSAVNYNNTTFSALNTSTFLVDVNNDNFSLNTGTTITGTGGKLYLTFSGPPSAPYSILSDVIVQSGGSDYSQGSYILNASGVSSGLPGTISNLNISVTSDQQVLGLKYEAVPISTQNEPFNGTGSLKSFGLIINVNGTGTSILNGGDGYIKNDIVYINQLDNNLNSLIGPSFDPQRLTKENMQLLPYVTIIAPSVASKGTCLEPAQKPLYYSYNDQVGIDYNFWDDSPGVYTSCPQQIALMDSVHRKFYTNQGLCLKNGIKDIFLSDTVAGFTTIENLKTIQFQDLNYRSDGMVGNINGQSYLQIGRFIPYQTIQSPIKANPSEVIPTAKGTSVWVNYNWCQFIPYGVKGLYQKRFSNNDSTNPYKNLPTF